MKRLSILLLLVCAAGVCLTVQARQITRLRGSGGWGADTRYEQQFDNFNLTTVTGTVVHMDTVTPSREMTAPAVRLMMNIGGRDIPVHLGPMWYIMNQDVNFPRGESLEVRGFRANFEGSEFIMPVELRSRDRIFRFRDDDGNPFWNIHRPRTR